MTERNKCSYMDIDEVRGWDSVSEYSEEEGGEEEEEEPEGGEVHVGGLMRSEVGTKEGEHSSTAPSVMYSSVVSSALASNVAELASLFPSKSSERVQKSIKEEEVLVSFYIYIYIYIQQDSVLS
jgi:hypothetical protein